MVGGTTEREGKPLTMMQVATPVKVHASLPPSPLASRAAREVIRPLQTEVPRGVFETLQLLMSELVTNGVRHGKRSAPVELTVTMDDETVHAEVRNGRGATVPRLSRPGERVDGGLGLILLDRLARRWGSDADRDVVVWFDLPIAGGGGH